MASKIQFLINADHVDIEALWKAMTKDKFEVASKATPDLFKEGEILEGDFHGNVTIGSLLQVTLGPVTRNVEPFKERIADFDEVNHLLSFQAVEGGFLKLGITSYVLSFKLDHVEGNTIISTTFTYDLEKDFDGTQLLEEFIKLVKYYLSSVVSYVQQ